MSEKPCNSCDICGKFIPISDFELGWAVRDLITPDSECTSEEYETTCKRCLQKEVA